MRRRKHFATNPQTYQRLVAALLPYENNLESSGSISTEQLRIVISQIYKSTKKTFPTKKEKSLQNFIRVHKNVILEDVKRIKENGTIATDKSKADRQNYFQKCAEALSQFAETLRQGTVTIEMAQQVHEAITSKTYRPPKKNLEKHRRFIRLHRQEILDKINISQSSPNLRTSIMPPHLPDPAGSESSQSSTDPPIALTTRNLGNASAEFDESCFSPSMPIQIADLPNASSESETTIQPVNFLAGSDSIEDFPSSSMSIRIISPDTPSPRSNHIENSPSLSMEMRRTNSQNSPNTSESSLGSSIRITTANSIDTPDCIKSSHSLSIEMKIADSPNTLADSELNSSFRNSSKPITTIDSPHNSSGFDTSLKSPGLSMLMKTSKSPNSLAGFDHSQNYPSPSMVIKKRDSRSASANQSPLALSMPMDTDNLPNTSASPGLSAPIMATNSPHASGNFDSNKRSPGRLTSKRSMNSSDQLVNSNPTKKRRLSFCQIF